MNAREASTKCWVRLYRALLNQRGAARNMNCKPDEFRRTEREFELVNGIILNRELKA